MKKMILTLLLCPMTFAAFAQEYTFSVNKVGDGKQDVVFIPGFACSGDMWNETVANLGDAYTCHVLTMPGFAGVAPEKHPSFEGWKKQIARFITENGLKEPIIVGHSMGGGLALAIAADYPELADRIVVVDALPCLSALTNPTFQSDPNNDCTALVQQLAAVTDEQFAQRQRMSVATLTLDSTHFDAIVRWGVTSDRTTYALMYCDYANTDLRERIKHIRIPALLLFEANFKNIAPMVEAQYKPLSGAQTYYADRGLHFVMFDDKEWFMTRLLEFLKNK
jgi:pimeloyl-ACP methyl ester carboxylesterase